MKWSVPLDIYHVHSIQQSATFQIIDKKALAVIVGVNKFHQFLYGKKFITRADHNRSLGNLEKTKGYHHKLYLEFFDGH